MTWSVSALTNGMAKVPASRAARARATLSKLARLHTSLMTWAYAGAIKLLAALVMAVVTSNELIAWVCIAASVIGVVLLIVDALRERSRGEASKPAAEDDTDYC